MVEDSSTKPAKTWLVTGTSRGLGRALVQAILDRGDRVVATARRSDQLSDLVRENPARVRALSVDVTNPAEVQRAVQTAVDEFGSLDVVVNNAGYANSASVEDGTDEDFRAQIETNFFGVVSMTRAVLPIMRRQRSGHIIQVSSTVGKVGGMPGLSAYTAAKFALEGFSEVLRGEVQPLGIKVTVVEPSGLRTDWAGVSMAIAPVSPDYQVSVGEANKVRLALGGTQAGDPVRAAAAIVDFAYMDDAPERVLLGGKAVAVARKAANDWVAEIEQWAPVSQSIDFPVPG